MAMVFKLSSKRKELVRSIVADCVVEVWQNQTARKTAKAAFAGHLLNIPLIVTFFASTLFARCNLRFAENQCRNMALRCVDQKWSELLIQVQKYDCIFVALKSKLRLKFSSIASHFRQSNFVDLTCEFTRRVSVSIGVRTDIKWQLILSASATCRQRLGQLAVKEQFC